MAESHPERPRVSPLPGSLPASSHCPQRGGAIPGGWGSQGSLTVNLPSAHRLPDAGMVPGSRCRLGKLLVYSGTVPVPIAGSRDARRESCPALFDPHFPNLSTNTFPRNARQSVCTAHGCPVHLPCALTLKGPLPTSPGGAASAWPPWIGRRRPSVSAGPRGGWPWDLERLKESGGLPPG